MANKFSEIIAHRGLRGKAPENTMAAFRMAAELDIDGVEFDVQLSKDNKVVVIHDETLQRTTNGSGFVKDYTYEELKQLDAGSWFSEAFKGEKIPLLEDVLGLFRDYRFMINIELKNSVFEYYGLEKLVLEAVKKFHLEKRVIISSFNHYSIKKITSMNPEIKTAILCECTLFEPSDYMRKVGANDIHTSMYTLNRELIEYSGKNSIAVRCFTANQERDMRRLITMGVDGIFTDYPDVLISLKKR